MKQFAILIVCALAFAGCSSSKPAPKPFTWESDTNKSDAQKKVQQAETQDPCSAANLKTASAEQIQLLVPLRCARFPAWWRRFEVSEES